MQYLINTLFYHYSLYEYLFTQQQDEFIIGSDVSIRNFIGNYIVGRSALHYSRAKSKKYQPTSKFSWLRRLRIRLRLIIEFQNSTPLQIRKKLIYFSKVGKSH